MTAQEKMHSLELSERELAAILFILYKVNGRASYQIWKRCKGILTTFTGSVAIENTHKSLSKMCGYDNSIDYDSVEKDWETFLGIGVGVENKEILDKIANMERELTMLKGLL